MLKERLGVKITAIFLSYVTILLLVGSLFSTIIMGYYKFYFSSEELVKEEILTDMAEGEAYYIDTLITNGTNLKKYYKDKNVFYRLTDKESGKVSDTNYNGEEYFVTASSEYYQYREFSVIDENGNEYWESIPISTTTIEVFVAKNMTKSDMFSVALKIIEIGYSLKYVMMFIVLLSIILSVALLSFLYCAAGHKAGGVIECNTIDKIPFDLCSVFVVLAAILSITAVSNWSFDRTSAFVWIFIFGTLNYFIALGFTMSFATRVKTKTLIKNNCIYKVLKLVWQGAKKLFKFAGFIFKNLPIVYKTLVLVFCALIAEAFVFVALCNIYWAFDFVGLIMAILLISIIVFAGVIYLAIVLQKIKKGGEKIAKGDLEHKIDTSFMVGDFKDFSVSLNNINEGLQTAVNEKMKSERFKTELITNVSHDIKTPLTSIINYVDLIKKEKISNETVNGYVEVLDRQSSRLKKLVEDLVEASKASTGNLTVNLCECDVGVLLTQTVGEFEEKLKKFGLAPVLNLPEKNLRISADGRHLWRVLDNLMNNVCKYALEGTRVYIDLFEDEGKIKIVLRNISKYELNVSGEELMERFVRGDTSRNTEGSGLGISIAKSLVEIQGGDFDIQVDGDLFKAVISFDLLKSEENV